MRRLTQTEPETPGVPAADAQRAADTGRAAVPRLSAAPAVLGAAITAAVALWWLPGAWLQAAGGFADLPALSAQAAFCLVLAQGVLVCLFAPRWFGEAVDPGAAVGARIARDATGRNVASRAMRAPTMDFPAGALAAIAAATRRNVASRAMRAPTMDFSAGALAAIAPAWPLLALLWLTSGLSVLVLVASQLLVALAAVLLALTGRALGRTALGDPARDVLRGAAGIGAAAIVWSLREGLHTWVVPA